MTRIIGVVSGKGGVGKTTMVANLGTALAKMGKNVIILDANLTTPSLGLHLGVPLYPVTLHDVLKGRANIKDAIYMHESGVKIIPAGISLRDMRGVDSKDLPNALLEQLGTKLTGLILNRVTGKNYEMTTRDIMGMLDNINLIGEVPEDVEVQKSVAARNPVIRHSPKSDASNRIMRIAASLVGEEDNFREFTPWYKKMFSFSRR